MSHFYRAVQGSFLLYADIRSAVSLVSDASVDPVADISQYRKEQDRPDVVDEIDQEIADIIQTVVPAVGERVLQSGQETGAGRGIDLGFPD